MLLETHQFEMVPCVSDDTATRGFLFRYTDLKVKLLTCATLGFFAPRSPCSAKGNIRLCLDVCRLNV